MTRAEQTAQTQHAIVDVVVGLIEEQGHFTVAEVAERSGISPATIYRHCPNRSALIEAVARVDQYQPEIDPTTVPGGRTVRFKEILAHVEGRLNVSPLFRRRHKTAARGHKKTCYQCHQKATCLRCHGGIRKLYQSNFASGQHSRHGSRRLPFCRLPQGWRAADHCRLYNRHGAAADPVAAGTCRIKAGAG